MPKICNPKPSFQTEFKVSVVGCGNVGATAAYAMLLDGTPSEIVLFDIDIAKEKAEGIALDFEHSLPFVPGSKVTATDNYSALANSNLIVITAGARQREGETRLDLIKKNRAIFREMIPKIAKAAPDSIMLIVTNPVDVLTYEALKLSGFPRNRVFGTGTMLDTARLRFHLSEILCLSSQSIEAFIFGEHGDSSFPVWSAANVSGKPLFEFEGFTQNIADECFQKTKNAAYRIIHDVGYTCYSIGTVIREIMRHIFHHSKMVVPLSVVLENEYGEKGVSLSVPCILDSTGVTEIITVPLNKKEQGQLAQSAKTLRAIL